MTVTKIWPTGVAGIPGAGSVGDITCVTGTLLDANPGAAVTLIARDGYTKVLTIPFAATDTAAQVAEKLAEAIKAVKELETSAVPDSADVDLTQYRPGTAGDTTITLNSAATTAGMTKTDFASGANPTGDMQIIQAAIDVASPGDIIEMQWDEESGTPGVGTGVEEPWVFGGELVDDFLIKTSRNGVKVGSSERVTVASMLAAFWDFNSQMIGRPSFAPKYGRCLDINKRITLRGTGVDGEGVPKTKIHTETPSPYATYKDLHDVAMAADTFGYYELWGQMADAMTRLHCVIAHHEQVALEQLHFESCQVTVNFYHPMDMDTVHVTETIGIALTVSTDQRSVYPNWSETSPDYTNPEKSTVENCLFSWVNVGCVLGGQEMTFRGNTMKVYNTAQHGALSIWYDPSTPSPWDDRLRNMRRAIRVEGNTFDAHDVGRYAKTMEMYAGGATAVFENIVITGNDMLDHPTVSPRSGRAIFVYTYGGAVGRNIEISNNGITKNPAPIKLAGFPGGQILDSSVAGNVFDTTKFTDATHPQPVQGAYIDTGAQISLLRGSGIAVSGNNFVDSLIGVVEQPELWYQAAVWLGLCANSQVFQPAGTLPTGQGGIKNHLVDYAGYNNRVVGIPANDLIAPKGIGELVSDEGDGIGEDKLILI